LATFRGLLGPEHPKSFKASEATFRVRTAVSHETDLPDEIEGANTMFNSEDLRLALSNISSSSGTTVELAGMLMKETAEHGYITSDTITSICARDKKLQRVVTSELHAQVVEQAPNKATKIKYRKIQKKVEKTLGSGVTQFVADDAGGVATSSDGGVEGSKPRMKEEGVFVVRPHEDIEDDDDDGEDDNDGGTQENEDGECVGNETDSDASSDVSGTGIQTKARSRTSIVLEDAMKSALASMSTSTESPSSDLPPQGGGRRKSIVPPMFAAPDPKAARESANEEESEKRDGEIKAAHARRSSLSVGSGNRKMNPRQSLAEWWEGSGITLEDQGGSDSDDGDAEDGAGGAAVSGGDVGMNAGGVGVSARGVAVGEGAQVAAAPSEQQQQERQQQQQYYASYYAQAAVAQTRPANDDGTPVQTPWTPEEIQKYQQYMIYYEGMFKAMAANNVVVPATTPTTAAAPTATAADGSTLTMEQLAAIGMQALLEKKEKKEEGGSDAKEVEGGNKGGGERGQ